MNPWEKYAQQPSAPDVPPWAKYAAAGPAPAAQGGTGSPLERLPPDGSEAPALISEHADTIADRLLGLGKKAVGAGEAALSVATGIPAGMAGQLYGIGKTLTSGKYGTQAGIQQGQAAGAQLANRLTYGPHTQAGKDILEEAGKAMTASRLEGLPVEGPMLARIPEVPRGALAAGEGAANIAGKAAKGAVRAALPEIDPQTLDLARKAHAMGFRLTPDQVLGGKYAKAVGEGAAHVPFSGSNLKANQAAFTRNVAQQAGLTGDLVTRKAFAEGLKKWGGEIGDINGRYDIPVDRQFVQSLRANSKGQLPEVESVVNYYADMVQKKADNGVLPGATFRKLNTDLNRRISQTSNGDLRAALGNLQDDLLDAQQARMSPQDQTALQEARRHYAILKTIEPLVAKSPDGNISPASLMGALTSTKAGKSRIARGAAGQLGDLADIGQKFLKQPPSSGTAERAWAQRIPEMLGIGGVAAAPYVAVPAMLGTVGAANVYNRLGPAITNTLIGAPPR